MISNGADKWYAVGSYEQATDIYAVLLVEILQSNYALTYRICTHSSASGKTQGYSVAMGNGNIYIGSTATENAWTGDSGYTKMLAIVVSPTDYSLWG